MPIPVEYTLISQRNGRPLPAIGCLIEMEDVFVRSCGARMYCPGLTPRDGIRGKVRSRFRPYQLDLPQSQGRATQVLILTGLTFDVVQTLHSIPHWRERFDIVCAYVMDAHGGYDRPPRGRPSRFAHALSRLDHLFIPMSGNLGDFPAYYGLQASMVPYACDVLKWGKNRVDRHIDVIGYGRQNWEHSRALAKAFNAPESPRMYHHTDCLSRIEVANHEEQRALFWKTLQRCKIALAYDPLKTTPERFPFSILTQRWLECATAGCLIVGSRPTCPEADEYLDWPDATVELPASKDDLIPFIETLLADTERLTASHQRNYLQALQRHDWRHRFAQMLDTLGLPPPDALSEGLSELERRADGALSG